MPCGNECDTIVYNKAGDCPHCKMKLVMKPAVGFKTIRPADLCTYLTAHPDVLLLDVRTKAEFEGKTKPVYGRLKNAINIPIQELNERLPELTAYKNREIIVYCSHSQRSPRASYLLAQNGFINVRNMEEGMSAFSHLSQQNSCIEK